MRFLKTCFLTLGLAAIVACGAAPKAKHKNSDASNAAAGLIESVSGPSTQEAQEYGNKTSFQSFHDWSLVGPGNDPLYWQGRQMRWGFGYWNYMAYDLQLGYLDALRDKARAALVKARAEARVNNQRANALSEAINAITRSLQELENEMATLKAKRSQLGKAIAAIDSMAFDGKTTGVLVAIRSIASLASIPIETILEIKVDALASDEFRSRGRFKVVVDPDGSRRIVKNAVTAFGGGNMLQYLSFLNEHRQDVKMGGVAHTPLIALGDALSQAADQKLSELGDVKEHIKKQQRKRWKDLEKLADTEI